MVLVVILYPGPKSSGNNLHVVNIWLGIEGAHWRDIGYAVRYRNIISGNFD